MSQEAAAKFRDLIGQDRVLQQKVAAAMQGEADIDALVALGAERGCEFTADEASALIEETFGDNAEGELSDFELELVAGGASKGSSSKPKAAKAGTVNISTSSSATKVGSSSKGPAIVSSCGDGGVVKAGQVALSTYSTC